MKKILSKWKVGILALLLIACFVKVVHAINPYDQGSRLSQLS